MAADSEFANDATPETRDDTLVESPEDSAESTATRDDVAADNEFASDATPETRDDTFVESASDRAESTAVSDDTSDCSEVASDSTPETRDDTLVDSAEESVESVVERANLDVVTEFSSARISAVLDVVLLTTAELTLSIMLCIIDPVDSRADISASVSSVDGAPPTSAITAVVTALDILTISVLIASDSAESTAAREDVAD